MALTEVLQQKSCSPYYRPPPLHILVVETIEQKRVLSWQFGENSATAGVTKTNKVAAITDGKSVGKLTLFEEFSSKIKEGESYIMKGYNVRGQSPPFAILVAKETLFFRASAIIASEELKQAARDLLHPTSTLTALTNCHETRGLLSIKGKVIEISALKKVTSMKEQVPFRTIRVQQENTEMPVLLWREAAVADVPLGGTVTITHLKHSQGDYGTRLQATGFSKIEVEDGGTLERAEIVGVMEGNGKGVLNLLLASDIILEIDEKMWEPFEEHLKIDKVRADIQIAGNRVTSLKLVTEK